MSKDLWELANHRLPETAPVVRSLAKHDYAFVGVGKCGICGQPLAGYLAKGRSKKYHFYTCQRARKRLGGEGCQLGHIRVEHLESLVIDALAVLGKHPAVIQATVQAAVGQKSPESAKKEVRLREVTDRLGEIKIETERLEELIVDKKHPALAARMLDRAEGLLVEEGKLKDEKRVLELMIQHNQEKVMNRKALTRGLANLGKIIDVLPPAQRRELLQILVSRIVVKPWDGEPTGISGGSIAIAPEIGTKRYSVKISLSESSLLSTEFTNSVDGSTFAQIGCPGWDRTSDQVINSYS